MRVGDIGTVISDVDDWRVPAEVAEISRFCFLVRFTGDGRERFDWFNRATMRRNGEAHDFALRFAPRLTPDA